jgi:hypothetical protein
MRTRWNAARLEIQLTVGDGADPTEAGAEGWR